METSRSLTSEEISQLITQRCNAEDWSKIRVCNDFLVKYISDTTFSGEIYLGRFGKKLMLPGGVPVRSSIRRAHLHNCHISNNVFISHVSQYIANYSIGEGTIIENIGALYTEGESSFGSGTSVSVLDETGGRAVTIYEGISAHTAWLSVMYFHRPELIASLNKMALEKARSVRSTRGSVGTSCSIRNAGTLRNLRIGNGCEINGASILDDGSLCSAPSAFPGEGNEALLTTAYVGANVIARHFILAPGAVVKDGVQIERCFIGEAAELSKSFSAHDSLFFSNSQMENGEACASFLGPYSVSMHKGTLMVGGMFSFCNFGSSTNQSNHFYKLGPMHSGTLERGCKTGSSAYLLWPCRIGAFTFIKGSHTEHPVTTDFPYSFLLEDNGKSYLTPGASLRSIGTLRDELKWPQRDKRTSLMPADKICFDSSNPSIACAVARGLSMLKDLSLKKEPEYAMNGFILRSAAVVRGIKLYQSAMVIFKGAQLIRQLERLQEENVNASSLLKNLLAHAHPTTDEWLDASGLQVPQNELEILIQHLESNQIQHVDELEASWERLYLKSCKMAWQCALTHIAKDLDKAVGALTLSDFEDLIDRWGQALSSMSKTMLLDADYELNMMQQHGPGNCRPDHPFVNVLQRQLDELPARVAQFKTLLKC
jgi:hypothetical protein